MKLYYSATSPYARKVRIVAHEKGLATRIEGVLCNPWADPAELRAANPLGKVPTLLLDDGSPVYDSRTICIYLDSLTPEPRLIPDIEPARVHVLSAAALADGVIDLAVSLVLEGRRPAAQQSLDMMDRWRSAIERAVGAIGRLNLGADVNFGTLSLAVALAYLDFRLPSLNWRGADPALAEWQAKFTGRPSFTETAPPPGA